MLVDIEMPRMDGFDLTRNVRGDAAHPGHPDHHHLLAHRGEAPQPGGRSSASTQFLGKPYREAELLQHVARYTA